MTPPKPKPTDRLLNARERQFVILYTSPGDAKGDVRKAALAAEYCDGDYGYRLIAKDYIRAAIDKIENATVQEMGKIIAANITVTRSEIINGIHKEAKGAESDSARVTAWRTLAEIFQLLPKTGKDVDMFAGWTDEELDYYRRTGCIPPERIAGLSADNHEQDSEPGPTPLSPHS